MQQGELVAFGFPLPPPKPPLSPAVAAAASPAAPGGSAQRRKGKGGSASPAPSSTPPSRSATPTPTPTPTRAAGGGATAGAQPPPLPVAARPTLPAVVLSRAPPRAPPGAAPEWGFLSTRVLPHVALWAALAVPAVLVMHVQVATRFLSACPALYWYAAHVGGTRPAAGRLLWAWFLLYALCGTVLFVNFFPWT
jgi:hypothetical protein